MKHGTGIVAVALLVSVGAVFIAAQEALPRFEVASVKLNKAPAGPDNLALIYSPGRFVATGLPLLFLVTRALDLHDIEIERKGLPEWVFGEHYDIVALTGGPKTQPETNAMLRTLLEERFTLATHVEARKGRVFHLVRVRAEGALGRDIRPSAVDCDKLRDERAAANESKITEAQQKGQALALADRLIWQPGEACAAQGGQTVRGVNTLTLVGTTMAGLANRLRGAVAGFPSVIDHTGLAGTYALTLRFSRPDRRQPNATADTPFDAPLLEAALREQLGVKLEPHEGTTEIVAIDRIERPTED